MTENTTTINNLDTTGKRIRYLRHEKRMKLNQFAPLIPLSTNYLSLLEHDRRRPSFETAQKIADFTGVPVDWIQNGGPNTPSVQTNEPSKEKPFDILDMRPQMALIFNLLKFYYPNLFPDIICTFLNITPEEHDRMLAGERIFQPRWNGGSEIEFMLYRLAEQDVILDLKAILHALELEFAKKSAKLNNVETE